MVARQRGQVRQASERGWVLTCAVLDARGFVAADVTASSHLPRIERQPVCERELVVVEAPAAVGQWRCESEVKQECAAVRETIGTTLRKAERRHH